MSEFLSREVLLFLSNKFEGEWQKIFDALQKKEIDVTDEEIKKLEAITKANYVEITSPMYSGPNCDLASKKASELIR